MEMGANSQGNCIGVTAMTNKERLMRTLNGQSVDRPPVSFYELGGYHQDPHNNDEYNIYNDLSWRGLLELDREHTDKIVINSPKFKEKEKEFPAEVSDEEIAGSIHRFIRIKAPHGVL